MSRKIALAAAAAVLAAGVFAARVSADAGADADKPALRAVLSAYEMALNQDNMAALAPHAASGFTATTPTGHAVESFDAFKAYWQTFKGLAGIGPGLNGRYQTALEPLDTRVLGGYAVSYGTAKEALRTDAADAGGRREYRDYAFHSMWYALFVKEQGRWKLLSGHVAVDPFRTTFSDAKLREFSARVGAALVPRP